MMNKLKMMMVATGIAACAAQARAVNVSYVDADGQTQTTNAFVVTASGTRVTWNAGWYVVTNEVTLSKGVDCTNAVHLILADTGKLTISSVNGKAGIGVTGGVNSLAIYGQTLGTGALDVTGGVDSAGIGGDTRTAGSNITINGGTVTAKGGASGAGIGGGLQGNGSNITINVGTVMATGGSATQMGNEGGSGIGGGCYGAGEKITINGGTVTATGGSTQMGNGGSGIGGTTAREIRINGGKVTATGGNCGNIGVVGAGIGTKLLSKIYAADDVIVKAGTTANPTTEIAHTGTTDLANDTNFAGKQYVTAVKPNPTITGVTAQQRYPWNGKVDIEYTASDLVAAAEGKELAPAIKVLSVDRATTPWTTNYADYSCLFVGPSGKNALTDAEATKDGTHQIVWDMDKQGLSFVSTNVIFAVLGEALGGVQLWEGGPYWAECNVGAARPQDYGYYFWWGDTVGYKRNAANNGWVSVEDGVTAFTFAGGNCPTYQKDNAALKTAGYIDDTGNLVAAHDAATKHLGAPWRMPTSEEVKALADNCSRIWTGNWNGTGVAGYVVTGKGDYASKSIFLPAAGSGFDSGLDGAGAGGSYWSSSPHSGNSNNAWRFCFYSGDFCRDVNGRYVGQPVRPVRGFAK